MFPCSIYKSVYYFTLQEVFAGEDGSSSDGRPFLDFTGSVDNINDLLGATYSELYSSLNVLKPYVSELFKLLYARYYDHYIFGGENERYSQNLNEWIHFSTNIVSIFVQTYDRYALMLGMYASEKDALLDGVKTLTTGVGRFNDTPQNLSDGDEFGDNTHVSNITKSTAEAVSDYDTKIARIDEIARKYRNLLKDWTNEFDGLFIERGNIE